MHRISSERLYVELQQINYAPNVTPLKAKSVLLYKITRYMNFLDSHIIQSKTNLMF